MTVEELQALLVLHDDGVLKHGLHKEGSREFCALEFDHTVRGQKFSDKPDNLPDLRPLNDAMWPSDQARTDALLPVMSALWDWQKWSRKRRTAFVTRVAIYTVNRIIAELPGLPKDVADGCRRASTLLEARSAVWATGATWGAAETPETPEAVAAAAEAAWAGAGAARTRAATWAATWAAEAVAAAAEAAWAGAGAAARARAGKAKATLASQRPLLQGCQILIDAAEETDGL